MAKLSRGYPSPTTNRKENEYENDPPSAASSVNNMTEEQVKAMVVEVFGSEEAAKESADRIYKCAKAMFDRGLPELFSTRGKQKMMIEELRPVPYDAIIGDLDKIPETHRQAMKALDAQFRLVRFPKLTIQEDEQQTNTDT